MKRRGSDGTLMADRTCCSNSAAHLASSSKLLSVVGTWTTSGVRIVYASRVRRASSASRFLRSIPYACRSHSVCSRESSRRTSHGSDSNVRPGGGSGRGPSRSSGESGSAEASISVCVMLERIEYGIDPGGIHSNVTSTRFVAVGVSPSSAMTNDSIPRERAARNRSIVDSRSCCRYRRCCSTGGSSLSPSRNFPRHVPRRPELGFCSKFARRENLYAAFQLTH